MRLQGIEDLEVVELAGALYARLVAEHVSCVRLAVLPCCDLWSDAVSQSSRCACVLVQRCCTTLETGSEYRSCTEPSHLCPPPPRSLACYDVCVVMAGTQEATPPELIWRQRS